MVTTIRKVADKVRGREPWQTAWDSAPEGKPAQGVDLRLLLNVPEVAGVATEGEQLGGCKIAAGHVGVQFWPFLQNGRGSMSLTVPFVFSINTTARRDHPLSGYVYSDNGHADGVNHWSRVVSMLNSGHPYAAGRVCRGDASFVPDPIACTLMLRVWAVQTISNEEHSLQGHPDWWKNNAEAFFAEHGRPRVVLIPSRVPSVEQSGVYVLPQDVVETYVETRGAKQQWLGPKE